jgi:hypothetical protein
MAANRRRLEHGLQAGDLEDLPASGDNYTPWKDKPWQALAGMTIPPSDVSRPDCCRHHKGSRVEGPSP